MYHFDVNVSIFFLQYGEGNPLSFEVTSAKGDERKQVENLIDQHME